MIKCPKCSGSLKFNPVLQKISCTYCKTNYDINDINIKSQTAEENINEFGKNYKCSQCGAELLTYDDTVVTFCSYCGSQALIESKITNHNAPSYIIPFSITKEQCIENYKKIIRKSIYAPSYFKEDVVIDKFRGIYIPYGIYVVSQNGICCNKGIKYIYNQGREAVYYEYDILTNLNARYDGITRDLTSKFDDAFSSSIPFNCNGLKEYNVNYLLGYYVDSRDVDSSIYNREIENLVNDDTVKYLGRDPVFFSYNCFTPRANLKVTDSKLGLFPVYFLTMRSKNSNNIRYAMVNGQTGEVTVDMPVSFKKYIFISLITAIPLFLIIGVVPAITSKVVFIFSIIILVISLSMSNNQLNKLYAKEKHLDDKGHIDADKIDKLDLNYKVITIERKISIGILFGAIAFIILLFMRFGTISLPVAAVWELGIITYIVFYLTNNKSGTVIPIMPFKEKIKHTYKQYIAVIISVIGLQLEKQNFTNTTYHYVITAIIFLLIILTFKDLVKIFNDLTSRKISQLEKRGEKNEK